MTKLEKMSFGKMSFQSTLENSRVRLVKRSSHKSFHNVAEGYQNDRAPYPLVLIYGTTSMHLPLDLSCLLGLYFITTPQI